jgi:hypothetical protein
MLPPKTKNNQYDICVLSERLPQLHEEYGATSDLPKEVRTTEYMIVCKEHVRQFREVLV